MRSASPSSAAIALNARARSPTSSRDVARTRRSYSPRAIAVLAAAISRSGDVIPRARICTMIRPSTAASVALSGSDMPALWPNASTTAVPHDRGDDHHAELDLDRAEAVERSHGSSA